MKEQSILHEYRLESNFTHLGTDAQWTFASKGGEEYFIKRFVDPVWPTDSVAYSADYIREAKAEYNRFYERKKRLYDVLKTCDNGNIVIVDEFFLEKGRFHTISRKIPSENIDVKEISALPDKDKYLILRTITLNMMWLHQKGIVYADIRPDNILFKRTSTGKLVTKLIDFDGSFFEDDCPEKGIPLSEAYIAPEAAELLIEGKPAVLTKKIDIFSLGILYHLYWTGTMPQFSPEYDFVCEAVNYGGPLTLSGKVPARMADLIRRMLEKDPAKRPSAQEAFDELKAIQEGRPSDGGKDAVPAGKENIFFVIADNLKPGAEAHAGAGITVKINMGRRSSDGGEKGPPSTGHTGTGLSDLWSVPSGF